MIKGIEIKTDEEINKEIKSMGLGSLVRELIDASQRLSRYVRGVYNPGEILKGDSGRELKIKIYEQYINKLTKELDYREEDYRDKSLDFNTPIGEESL